MRKFSVLIFITFFTLLTGCLPEAVHDGSDSSSSEVSDEDSDRAVLGLKAYANKCASCHNEIDQSRKIFKNADQILNAVRFIPRMNNLSLTFDEAKAIEWVLAGNRPKPPGGGDENNTCTTIASAQESDLKRFTRQQIANSIRDLFYTLPEHPLNDLILRGYNRDYIPDDFTDFDRLDRSTDLYHIQGYFLSAQRLKDYIEPNARAMTDFVSAYINKNPQTCQSFDLNSVQENCITAFISNFGLRAFKKKLTQQEVDSFLATFYDNNSSPRSGYSSIIFRMLISPRFLFEIYDNDTLAAGTPDIYELSSHEIIQKLSYRLWDTMPDDYLFELAEQYDLSQDEPFKLAIEHIMSQEDKLQSGLESFFTQWTGVTSPAKVKFSNLSTRLPRALILDSGVTFPEDPNNPGQPIRHHLLSGAIQSAMFDEIKQLTWYIFNNDSSFKDLFTTDISFTDSAPLMQIYGVNQPAPATITPQNAVRMPAGTRSGIMTRGAFLTEINTVANPIHRSISMREKFLCMTVDAPPADLPAEDLIAPVPTATETTRTQYTHKTSPNACMSCHRQINPFGFIYGKYNAFGAFADQEVLTYSTANGVSFPEARLPVNDIVDFSDIWPQHGFVNGPVELSHIVGDSIEARYCFTKKYVSYMNQKVSDPTKHKCDIDQVAGSIQQDTLKSSLMGIFKNKSFRYRKLGYE